MGNWDGMLPAHPCKKCGKMLGASGNPAELYAGCSAYTGLCDKCARGPAFVVEVDVLDGKITWSHPPSRYGDRDRKTHVAYAGCPDCGGRGVVLFHGQYESFNTYCKRCSDRSCEHPLHQGWSQAVRDCYDRSNAMWLAEIKAMGGRVKGTKKNPLTIEEESLAAAVSEWMYPQYKQMLDDTNEIWVNCLDTARSIAPPIAAI